MKAIERPGSLARFKGVMSMVLCNPEGHKTLKRTRLHAGSCYALLSKEAAFRP
jgi:hypothetical protein